MIAYLEAVRRALNGNRTTYFPPHEELRRRRNLKLGREIGFGLGSLPDWLQHAKDTYGAIVVANSFDSTGVAIDNKDWIAAIREGVEQYRESTHDTFAA